MAELPLELRFFRWLPERLRRAIAVLVGAATWTLRIRRKVALDNLALAFPEKTPAERRRIARAAYGNLAMAALDFVTSDLLPDNAWSGAVQVDDWCGLDALALAGKPVLVASAHLGSWELFAEAMSRRGVHLSAVVRPLSGRWNALGVENRRKSGVELILQRGALKEMYAALRRGRTVVQLVDQSSPRRHPTLVPFFGHLATTSPALSVVAVRTGVPTYVVVAVRSEGKLRMEVSGPVPLPEGLHGSAAVLAHATEISRRIEGFIRRYPEQWLWLHRRWKRNDIR